MEKIKKVTKILSISLTAILLIGASGCDSQNATQSNIVPPSQSRSSGSSGVDMDCGDFDTHDEAQDYFESNGGSPSNNFDNLDRDRDGVACETLP